MDKKSGFTKHGLPLFDGHNYAFWSIMMKLFLQTQGVDVWQAVLNEYSAPTSIQTDVAGKKLYERNSKAMYVILGGLAGSEFVKVMHCIVFFKDSNIILKYSILGDYFGLKRTCL